VKLTNPIRAVEFGKGKRVSDPTAPNPERPLRMIVGIVR
jgi:hypothetical protein